MYLSNSGLLVSCHREKIHIFEVLDPISHINVRTHKLTPMGIICLNQRNNSFKMETPSALVCSSCYNKIP
jgi:hypothetical protein